MKMMVILFLDESSLLSAATTAQSSRPKGGIGVRGSPLASVQMYICAMLEAQRRQRRRRASAPPLAGLRSKR